MSPAFPTGIDFDAATAIVDAVARANRLAPEEVSLARAHGRILAEDVAAPIPLQPFDNSAMDGYALRHADLSGHGDTALRLVGEQFAGRALGLAVGVGECIRITTGAPMPEGADTVAIQERVRIAGDHAIVPPGVRAGANVRRAGEDARAGERILPAGCVLTPARVSVAAALGLPRLVVTRRPTVAVFTTGDELVEPCLPLRHGEIHDSNRELLMGLLRADGLEPTAWPTLPDAPGRVAAMLQDAASSFDLVLSCGGVSAGAKDHVPALLATQGTVHFWKVRMKPGMPLLFGDLGAARFVGLPGNPVSVLATWLTLGRRLVDGLQGRGEARPAWRARLADAVETRHARREFIRGRLAVDEGGTLRIVPDAATGSHRLVAASACNALLVVPEGPCRLEAGAVVEVLPY